MALPDSALPYWRQQQSVNFTAVAIASRAWRTSGGDLDRWMSARPLLVSSLTRAQETLVGNAEAFIDRVLAEQSIDVEPLATVDAKPLLGFSSTGVSLTRLHEGLPNLLAANMAQTESRQAAMDMTTRQFQASVQTLMSDTSRNAESLHIAVRPGVGYVRMLVPPSCERCVVQAGKYFRWNTGFKRHPRCDCRHIPSRERGSGDLRVNPKGYFHSLTAEAQEQTFGKAAAQAIRDGSDISQVVNADRGMQTAQVYGRELKITLEGVTRYGRAGRLMQARGRSAATTPRLMPETIYQIAEDRDDAVRLLKLNGYIAE